MTHFSVLPLNRTLEPALRARLDGKTKPPGSLGRLEDLAVQAGLVQGRLDPRLRLPAMLVFAGDHGLARAGVSPYPQAVTAQMVANFLRGGAAINVMCRAGGLDLEVINAGVAGPLPASTQLVDCAVGPGTANMLDQPAMSLEQAVQALDCGAERVRRRAALGCTVVALGEMGIGNTSSASLLTARLTGLPLPAVTGRGTGLDDVGLQRKIDILQQVAARHPNALEPLDVLAAFGGFEIAMLVGAILQAASDRLLIIVDGFIVSAAALVASRLQPNVLEYCVFAHCSQEAGHRALLRELQAEPLLDLGLRLGEGSGAAAAWPVVQMAVALLNDMASFEQAGVSRAEG